MPLKSRLTSPAREARTTEPEASAEQQVPEPTTSPRRRHQTVGTATPAPAPVESENLSKDIAEGANDGTPEPADEVADTSFEGTEPADNFEPENPDQRAEAPKPKRRGPKPGTKRAPRRIALPVDSTGESLDIGAAKQRMKAIEGEAAALLQEYQKNLAELESEHRELAIQISAATFGH